MQVIQEVGNQPQSQILDGLKFLSYNLWCSGAKEILVYLPFYQCYYGLSWEMKASKFKVDDRVEVYLTPDYWKQGGWFKGTVIRIEPYTQRRNFYWVKLDEPVESKDGVSMQLISVINLKNIRNISTSEGSDSELESKQS